ncbi:MAG: 6-phosphofructokinase, partial [Oscillospiraceae bacterium]|nr:6-phosphofructokinase [Oscillospiraceae bacterium]
SDLMPYNIDNVCAAVNKRNENGRTFTILAVAEGVYDTREASMKKKERLAKRMEKGETTATSRIAADIQRLTGCETRVAIPGHIQRGGSPSAYDRVLATRFGTYAAKLVEADHYGVAVAMKNNIVTENALSEVAGKSKLVPETCDMLNVARRMGICLG